MRLMMRSLLADRFKLATHNETREVPLFAYVLTKNGKTGPSFGHTDNSPCPTNAYEPERNADPRISDASSSRTHSPLRSQPLAGEGRGCHGSTLRPAWDSALQVTPTLKTHGPPNPHYFSSSHLLS
jgi:uncharacterized protein (TIGR03435 family)